VREKERERQTVREGGGGGGGGGRGVGEREHKLVPAPIERPRFENKEIIHVTAGTYHLAGRTVDKLL